MTKVWDVTGTPTQKRSGEGRVGLGTEGGGWCACYSFQEPPKK